jgi:PncC family amidohydrolase
MTIDISDIKQRIQSIGDLLSRRAETVATAESCTAGLVSFLLTSIDGSSEWLNRSYVTYSDNAKIWELEVKPQTIADWSVYSQQVAREMARGAKHRAKASYGVGVTGLCGSGDYVHHGDAGSITIPEGTIWIAVSGILETTTEKIDLFDIKDRNLRRQVAAQVAIELLYKCLVREVGNR